jgi:hypothetical protein
MGRNDEIRHIAYGIWEREGRPEGHALEHWQKAEKMWASQHKTPQQSASVTERKGQSVASAPRMQPQSSAASWPS